MCSDNMTIDPIHELKERIKLYESERTRTFEEIQVHKEKIKNCELHIGKLDLLVSRVSDIIIDFEFERMVAKQ